MAEPPMPNLDAFDRFMLSPPSDELLHRLITATNLPRHETSTWEGFASAIHGIELQMLRRMVRRYPKGAKGKANTIHEAATRLKLAMFNEGASKLLARDTTVIEREKFARYSIATTDVILETLRRADIVLFDLARQKRARLEGVLGKVQKLVDPLDFKVSEFIAGPVADAYEIHFGKKAGSSTPKPGALNKSPYGPFIRFTQAVFSELDPTTDWRLSPSLIQGAARLRAERRDG